MVCHPWTRVCCLYAMSTARADAKKVAIDKLSLRVDALYKSVD